jgi:fibronectin type 3 domain-containing protein
MANQTERIYRSSMMQAKLKSMSALSLLATALLCLAAGSAPAQTPPAKTFVHPGIWVSQAQLDYVKAQFAAKTDPYYHAITTAQGSVWGTLYGAQNSKTDVLNGTAYSDVNGVSVKIPLIIPAQTAGVTYGPNITFGNALPINVIEGQVVCGSGTRTTPGGSSPDEIRVGCDEELNAASVAYTQALLWAITGNVQYATSAMEVMDYYSGYILNEPIPGPVKTMTSAVPFQGYVFTTYTAASSSGPGDLDYSNPAYLEAANKVFSNAPLQATWASPQWMAAAEILHSYQQANPANAISWPGYSAFVNMLTTYYYAPWLAHDSFYDDHNGNWILTLLDTRMSYSVLTENPSIYNAAIAEWELAVPATYYSYAQDSQFKDLSGNPAPFTYPNGPSDTSTQSVGSGYGWNGQTIFNADTDGVGQEICRDAAHAQYSLSALTSTAETAFIQNDPELYTSQQARLASAMEFQSGIQIAAITATNINNINQAASAAVPTSKLTTFPNASLLCEGQNANSQYGYVPIVKGTMEKGHTALATRLGVPLPNTINYLENYLRPITDSSTWGTMVNPAKNGPNNQIANDRMGVFWETATNATDRADTPYPPYTAVTLPTAPANLAATAASGSVVNLSWTASTDSASTVTGYNIYRNHVYLATSAVPSYTDSNAGGATTYDYIVYAVDAAKNQSLASNSAFVTTPSIPGGNGPTEPSGLSATAATSTIVNLNWTPSTDSASTVTGYNIARNNVLIASSATPSYTDAGVVANTFYTYTVTATDAAGKASPASNFAVVTTPSLPTLTITADNQTVAQNGALPVLSYSVSPSVALSSNPTCLTTLAPSTTVGLYPIMCSGAAAGGYTVAYVTGVLTVTSGTPPPANFSLTVSPLSQTVTVGSGTTYTVTVSPLNGYTGNVSLSVTGLPSGTGSTFSPATVTGGSGSSTLTVTTSSSTPTGSNSLQFSGTDGTLTNNASATLVVNAATSTVTVTANNQTMAQGSPLPAFTFTASPNITFTTPPTCTPPSSVNSSSSAGSYTITCSGAVAPGYTLNYITGVLTIEPVITITAENQTITYGDSIPTPKSTKSPSISLTTNPVCSQSANSSSLPNGTTGYPITCTGAAKPGYAFIYVAGTLTINPLPVTIEARNQTMKLGASLPTFTPEIKPSSAAFTTPPTCTTTATSSSPVGTYPITCSGAVGAGETFTYIPAGGAVLTIKD